MKRVYKYATGDVIPEDAVYLSTQVETLTQKNRKGELYTSNELVWHYFLVEV